MSMLFAEESEAEGTPEISRHDTASVYILVKRGPSLSRAKFKHALLGDLTEHVKAAKYDLNYSGFRQYHLVRGGGLLAMPYIATRKHFVVSLLCRARGIAPPEPFQISLFPRYDAAIELEFDGQLSQRQAEVIGGLVDELSGISARVSVMESPVNYVAFDDNSPSSKQPFYMLFLAREPANIPREQAQAYWVNDHAAFVLNNINRFNMQRYRIVHSTLDKSSSFDNTHSGIAVAEFRGLGAFMKNMLNIGSARFNNNLVLDEMNVTAESAVMFTKAYDMENRAVGTVNER